MKVRRERKTWKRKYVKEARLTGTLKIESCKDGSTTGLIW